MNNIDELGELECRVLANLNEAGEDYVSALLNSVLHCMGEDTEPARFINVISTLYDHGLVEFAQRRDEITLKWIVLPREETNKKLKAMPSILQWEVEAGFWRWNTDEPRLTVQLTPCGYELSTEVLENFGWDIA